VDLLLGTPAKTEDIKNEGKSGVKVDEMKDVKQTEKKRKNEEDDDWVDSKVSKRRR
jgi:hypothetical protein